MTDFSGKVRHVSGMDAYFVPSLTAERYNSVGSASSGRFSTLQVQDDSSTSVFSSNSDSGSCGKLGKEIKWKELTKSLSLKHSKSSNGSTTITTMSSGVEEISKVDKATDTKTLIEQQRQSYVRRLQREIRWLEKVEKLLSENQKTKKDKRKKQEDRRSMVDYESLPLSHQRIFNWKCLTNQDYEIEHRINECFCNCHKKSNDQLTEMDRSFITITTSSPKKKLPENKMMKNLNSRHEGKKAQPTNKSDFNWNSEIVLHRPTNRARNPGVAWYVPMGETKPWLETRNPGDGSHSTGNRADDETILRTMDKLSLQEAARYFKGNAIVKSQARREKIGDAARRRKHKTQLNYILLNGQRHHQITIPNPETEMLHNPQKRVFTHSEMRNHTEKMYRNLPEVVDKVDCRRKQENVKTNRLRAQIFKRKLQEGLLGGKITYSLTEHVQRGLWD